MSSKACSTNAADDDDGRSSAQVLFRWEHPGSQSVAVSGAWCAWSETATPLLAERGVAGRDGVFKGERRLPYGKHLFRFFVDGVWRHDPQLLSVRDEETGELCNVMNVSQESKLRLQLPEKPSSSSSSPPSAATAAAPGAPDAPDPKEEALISEPQLVPPPPTPTTSEARSNAVAGGVADVADVGDVAGAGGGVAAAVTGLGEGRGGPEEQRRNGSGSSSSSADAGSNDRRGSANANVTASEGCVAPAAAATGAGVVGAGAPAGTAAAAAPPPPATLPAAATAATTAAATAAAATAPAPAGMKTECASVTYRRRQQESFSAVGACVVTSSVRKDGKLLVAMVGLPARGKSFVARSIARHLDWVGLKSRIFSLGVHRRREVGVFQPAEYFEPGGDGEKVRRRIASEVLAKALTALKEDIDIAIYDASNITRERRLWLAQEVAASGLRCKVVFIESICNDKELVRQNVLAVRQSSPEYEEKTREEAEADFLARIAGYERSYQPLESDEGFSFIKLIDVGNQMVTNLISGYIPGRITLLCLNLHLKPRPIWMSRHGESEFNMQGRIGGDAPLTEAGKVYAGKLAEFMRKLYPPSKCSRDSAAADGAGRGGSGGGEGKGEGDGEEAEEDEEEEELVVWTSTMLRTGQTVAPMIMEREVIKWSQLTEISAGLMDSLTYDYVAAEMPQEHEARQKDKLRYRYPAGESYQDLFSRLEPVLFEMLRQRSPLLVVGHQAILRVLYGYLTGKDPEECPTLDMPLHTAIKLTPMAYTCEEEWHRPLEECDEPVADVKHPISDAQSA